MEVRWPRRLSLMSSKRRSVQQPDAPLLSQLGVSFTTVWRLIGTRGMCHKGMSKKYAYRQRRIAFFDNNIEARETGSGVGGGRER